MGNTWRKNTMKYLKMLYQQFHESTEKLLMTLVREGALSCKIHARNLPNAKRVNATTFCSPYANA
jgi:hypothetical protein